MEKLADKLGIGESLGEIILKIGKELNLKRGKWEAINAEGYNYQVKGEYNLNKDGLKLTYEATLNTDDDGHWFGIRLVQNGKIIDEKSSWELCDRTYMYLIIKVLANWYDISI